MPNSLARRLALFAVLSLIAAIGLAWWLGSLPDADTWRDEFPPEVALGETICEASERGGLLEASSIAIFALNSDAADRLGQDGLSFLNREAPPPIARKRMWTPWVQVESGNDLPTSGEGASSENLASRARRFVVQADKFTHNRCLATIEGLDGPARLFVSNIRSPGRSKCAATAALLRSSYRRPVWQYPPPTIDRLLVEVGSDRVAFPRAGLNGDPPAT